MKNTHVILTAFWEELSLGLRFPDETSHKVFGKLQELYSEEHRAYHNCEHILSMLQGSIVFPYSEALHLAIWFHDCIYVPGNKKNEEKSAAFAVQALNELNVDPKLIDQVVALIKKTRYHFPVEKSESEEMKQLLDLDLLVLGKSPEAYQEYVMGIRNEFSAYPDLLYKPGRKTVLNKFLAAPAIYRTAFFVDKYEKQARVNLTTELSLL